MAILLALRHDICRLTVTSASRRCILTGNIPADQLPDAERRRKLHRPKDDPGPSAGSTELRRNFPVIPVFGVDSAGKTEGTSRQRAAMWHSSSPPELLNKLRAAIKAECIDASVIGAAMQRCGQNRWWGGLQEIRKMQQEASVKLWPLQRNIYITALTRSIRGERGFGAIPERRQQLVLLGKQAWEEAGPALDADTFRSGLGAALRLCAAAEEAAALSWAEELWTSAGQQSFPLNRLAYEAFVLVLAVYRLPQRVDKMLSESTSVWQPSHACLGALVNVAAEQRDWRRAEELWKRFVVEFHVEPGGIEYGCRAKAHMLCGRPAAAASAVEEALGKNISLMPELAESQVQALLVICHSSLAPADFDRLSKALERGEPIVSEASTWQRKTWVRMRAVASGLGWIPEVMPLSDVLVEWKAQQSAMATWEDCLAGSKYLERAT